MLLGRALNDCAVQSQLVLKTAVTVNGVGPDSEVTSNGLYPIFRTFHRSRNFQRPGLSHLDTGH